ncbi:hypothetical protein V3C99_018531, partial [Haemonchus contortus]
IELCQNDLQDDTHTFMSSSNNDTLLGYIAVQHNHRITIIAKLDKLQRLNDEWSTEHMGQQGTEYELKLSADVQQQQINR